MTGCYQDPRDAEDATRKLDGFKGWVRIPLHIQPNILQRHRHPLCASVLLRSCHVPVATVQCSVLI